MTRPELHRIPRRFFDCTSVRQAPALVPSFPMSETVQLKADMPRSPLGPTLRYGDIKVALRLAA